MKTKKKTASPFLSHSSNGYILTDALCLFALVLLLCASLMVTCQKELLLAKADKQNQLDLAVMEQAKDYAGRCSWRKRCLNDYEPLDPETVQIQECWFELSDQSTYVQARKMDGADSYVLNLYYDQSGIIKAEYSAQ